MNQGNSRISKSGFTLAELIVVITVLAVLSTIGLLSFSEYASTSRDSVRAADMANFEKAMELHMVGKGSYPPPSNPRVHTGWANWTSVTQGFLNGSLIWFSKATPTDPLTKEPYAYSVSGNGAYYQIWWEMEGAISRSYGNGIIGSAYAAWRVAVVAGNYRPDPSLPSLLTLSGSVPSSASGWLYSPEACFVLNGSSANLLSKTSEWCGKKFEISQKESDSGLVGYWDMETLSWSYIKDLSWNGADWVLSWSVLPSSTGGLLSKGYYFSGSSLMVTAQPIRYGGSPFITVEAIVRNKPSVWAYTILLESSSNANSNTGSFYVADHYVTPNCDATKPLTIPFMRPDLAWGRNVQCPYDTSSLDAKHVTVIENLVKNEIRIFINGKSIPTYWMVGNSTLPPSSMTSQSFLDYEFHVWRRWSASWNGTVWMVDEIKVYNRALSDAEILQHARMSWF